MSGNIALGDGNRCCAAAPSVNQDLWVAPVPITSVIETGRKIPFRSLKCTLWEMRPSRLQNSLEAMAKSSMTGIFSAFSQVRSMA